MGSKKGSSLFRPLNTKNKEKVGLKFLSYQPLLYLRVYEVNDGNKKVVCGTMVIFKP